MWTGAENQIELFLIRHGLTQMNEEHRYIGTTDQSLSESGVKAVSAKASDLEFIDVSDFDYVFSGPMKRVKETAEIFFPEVKIVDVPEWTEINFGDFEGKNYQELSGNPDYQKWIDSNGEIPFPNGEDRKDFISRSCKGLENVIEYLTNNSEGGKELKVACFMHGGNIMAIMYSLFGGEYFSYQAKPAEGYRVKLAVAGGKKKILGVRDLR